MGPVNCLLASLVALEHVAVGDEGDPGDEGRANRGGALAKGACRGSGFQMNGVASWGEFPQGGLPMLALPNALHRAACPTGFLTHLVDVVGIVGKRRHHRQAAAQHLVVFLQGSSRRVSGWGWGWGRL